MSDSNRPYGYVCLHKLTKPDTHVWVSCGAIIVVEPNFLTREEQRYRTDPYSPNGSIISIYGGLSLYVKEKPDEVAAAIAEAVAFYTPIIREDFSPSGGCV